MLKYFKNKYILFGTIALVLFLVYWFLLKEEIDSMLPGNKNPNGNLNTSKILKMGSKGKEVGALQTRIKKESPNINLGNTGINKDGVDNDFGGLTQAALMAIRGVTEITLSEFDKGGSKTLPGGIYKPLIYERLN